MSLDLHLCDVFSELPLGGNSLTVVLHDEPVETTLMQALTRELRQFETVFVRRGSLQTRVFDLNRELAFAGHPLLGAAAVLHDVEAPASARRKARLALRDRQVTVTTDRKRPGVYRVELDAGHLALWRPVAREITARALTALSLEPTGLHDSVGCVVASTGLRYLIVPIERGIESARIVHPDLSELLAEVDAEFAYLLDVRAREGRHWENDGSVEDIATGSAAGVAGAFLVRHGFAGLGERVDIAQGRFTGRPSVLGVTVGADDDPERIRVAGPVTLIARGEFTLS
jgi:PhzF family phenazine biosynthesis protein